MTPRAEEKTIVRPSADHTGYESTAGSVVSRVVKSRAQSLRLVDARNLDWTDRAHFFAVCARVMRRILVDAARSRAAVKRGGHADRVEHSTAINLDRLPNPASQTSAQVCALDEALNMLAQMDPRQAHVIELRFFGGLTVDETAQVLQTSPQTVMRDWKLARAWLARELSRSSI